MQNIKIKTISAIVAIVAAIGFVSASIFTVVPAFAGHQGNVGCPAPSGDNQCGEAPIQREIGQVNQDFQGNSRDQLSEGQFGACMSGKASEQRSNNPAVCP